MDFKECFLFQHGDISQKNQKKKTMRKLKIKTSKLIKIIKTKKSNNENCIIYVYI